MRLGVDAARGGGCSDRNSVFITRWLGVAALVAASVTVGALPSMAQAPCKAPKELVHFTAPLQHLQRAVTSQYAIKIAALGSSSTAGTGASSPRTRYPWRLETELNRRFHPDRAFEVVNLGVGGQLATDMLARIDSEVLPLKPQLVIWQTGVNDAIRGIGVEDFQTSLARGVDTLKARGIDVILLDMQYYPCADQVAGYLDYLATMRKVAKEKNVPILHRFAIMKHLIESGQFTAAELFAPDLFHQNDLSYGCLGNLLADAIEDGLVGKPRSLLQAVAH